MVRFITQIGLILICIYRSLCRKRDVCKIFINSNDMFHSKYLRFVSLDGRFFLLFNAVLVLSHSPLLVVSFHFTKLPFKEYCTHL